MDPNPDDFYVTKLPDIKVKTLHLPIVRTAGDAIGREVVANMVALGWESFGAVGPAAS